MAYGREYRRQARVALDVFRTCGLSADGWRDRRLRRVRGGFAPRHNATLLLRSLRDWVPRCYSGRGDESGTTLPPLPAVGRRTLYELTRAYIPLVRIRRTPACRLQSVPWLFHPPTPGTVLDYLQSQRLAKTQQSTREEYCLETQLETQHPPLARTEPFSPAHTLTLGWKLMKNKNVLDAIES